MNNKINNNILYKTTRTTTPTPPAATYNNIIRSNGNQACAACKYQRRKCAPDCILAPYFPHDRQRQFLNAHKLFGVSNITKIIRYLDQPDKDEAMRTIIYQSDVRANDPVGGCYRIIRELQRQIEYNRAELQLVLHQLAYFRAQNQTQQQNNVNMLEPNNGNGLFDLITNNVEFHEDDQVRRQRDEDQQQQYVLQNLEDHQVRQLCDEDQQQQYVLHNGEGENEDQVHFEEINSWEAAQKSCCGAEDCCQEDIVKPFLDDQRQEEFNKFEAEEKSFERVNNFRLKIN